MTSFNRVVFIIPLIIICLFARSGAFCQTWERAFGFEAGKDEDALAICKTIDGNYIIGGEQEDVNITSCRIVKLSPFGDSIWSKKFSIPNAEQCVIQSCFTLTNGSFIVAGGCIRHINNILFQTCFVGKIDNNGNIIWLNEYSGNNVNSYINEIIESNDGGLICEGPELLMKIDDDGNYQWHKPSSYYGNDETFLSKFIRCSSNCYLGAIQDVHNSIHYITKITNTGEVIWKKETVNYLFPEFIILNPDRIFALGAFRVSGTNYLRLILQTYDTSGVYIQSKTLIIERNEYLTRNYLKIDSRRFLFSTITPLTLDTHYCTNRILDTNLNIIKSLNLTTFSGSRGIFSSIVDDKYICFVGYYRNLMMGGNDDFYIIKSDTNLNLQVSIGIKKITDVIPKEFNLSQNYPNPFNGVTQVVFGIKKKGNYSLKIYDVTGKMVEEVFSRDFEPGEYRTVINAEKLSSGIYFYRLESGDVFMTKKFVLVK